MHGSSHSINVEAVACVYRSKFVSTIRTDVVQRPSWNETDRQTDKKEGRKSTKIRRNARV